MRVLILGGGTVGVSVAEMLCGQQHSVTLIEKDPELASALDDTLEATVLCGSASQSSMLFQALPVDLALALTGVDEVNILAACMAKAMGARRVAARVYADVFFDQSTFDYQEQFRIDRMLSVEQLTAMEMVRHINEPGAMLIENFARGELEMQDLFITQESTATDKPLMELQLPPEVRIAAINRQGNVTIATARDRIVPGDRITLLGNRDDVEKVKKLFHTRPFKGQTLVIGGCGETGYHLATILQNRGHRLTILEHNRERCAAITKTLPRSTVICCDTRKRIHLEEQHVGTADMFIACMGEDEDNLLACVEASSIGTPSIMAVVNRPDYTNIIERLGINVSVSSRAVVARQVQALMNTGAVISRNSQLFGRGIDVIELEVLDGAPITQGTLREVPLPSKSLVGAVIRKGSVQVPHANFRFQPGDTVIALAQSDIVSELLKAFNP